MLASNFTDQPGIRQYSNELVLKVRKEMGAFNFDAAVPKNLDFDTLEPRLAIKIDEEIIYEGMWQKGPKNVREGKGL